MTGEALVRALADGRRHSGAALAEQLGVTRAAVWKQIARLEEWGLAVDARQGVGYSLRSPLDLIDAAALRETLSPRTASRIGRLEVFTELDSTNRYLLDAERPRTGSMAVCIAEYQTAGRGRRGRSWNAPLAGGLCLSAGWQFAETPPDLSALPLAAAVAARRAIERLTGVAVEIKWPNDLVWDGRKLGGILVDLIAEAQGGCHVVVGLGINVSMPPPLLAALSDWPEGAVDLSQATGGAPPRRAALAAAVLRELADLLGRYAATGFRPHVEAFRAADHLEGRRIRVAEGGRKLTGIARGIEADGALLVETGPGARRRVISGDVSVRAAP